MFIKTKISAGIRGSVEQIIKVKPLLKAIDEQFETSDKAFASTLIMQFSSTKLPGTRGVRDHIMRMRDIAAQLQTLEVTMSGHFPCSLYIEYSAPTIQSLQNLLQHT